MTIRLIKLIVAVSIAGGIVSAQTPAPGTEKKPRASRNFKPPPPRDPPEPFLHPPPEIPELLSGGANTQPSVFEQSQSLLGRTLEATPPPGVSAIIRAIIGFVALTVLAYLGGSRRVRALERQWHIAHAITTGLPFVLLGLIAASPQIRVLAPTVLGEVAPLAPLGIGCIGFVVGTRFETRLAGAMPNSTGTIAFVMTVVPVLLMIAPLAFTISAAHGRVIDSPVLRDAILLAVAGTIAARSAPEFLRSLLPNRHVSERLVQTVQLEQLAGVFGLMMISAYYRPPDALVAWQLPGTAWLFMTLGIGTTMGVLLYTTLTRITRDPQFTVVLLGCVAFAAGMASYLRISPLTVCFITGAIAANLGRQWQENIRQVFDRVERPVFFLFMVIAGALWHPWEWQGWALMLVFVSARFASKWVSSTILGRWVVPDLSVDEKRALTAAPMGALSVAIVLSAQDLYSGPTLTSIVTAVIGGALVTEIALQIARRRAEGNRANRATGYGTAEPLPEVD